MCRVEQERRPRGTCAASRRCLRRRGSRDRRRGSTRRRGVADRAVDEDGRVHAGRGQPAGTCASLAQAIRSLRARSRRLMRVLNTQQMREADRRTIDEIGIPSIVLMENAGRQVVAAMRSRVRRRWRPCASPCCAAAATTAATASSSRARCSSATSTSACTWSARAADVKGDARINLDVLRALGIDVVEIARRAGVGAARHRRRSAPTSSSTRCSAPGCTARSAGWSKRSSPTSMRPAGRSSPIDLPSGLSADSAGGARAGDRRDDDGDAGARRSCRSCCRRPRRWRATWSIADIGIPRSGDRRARRRRGSRC